MSKSDSFLLLRCLAPGAVAELFQHRVEALPLCTAGTAIIIQNSGGTTKGEDEI